MAQFAALAWSSSLGDAAEKCRNNSCQACVSGGTVCGPPRTGEDAHLARRLAMGKTLNLCDCLLTMGRELQDLGRLTDAAGVLHRLAAFRNLPAPIAEETHARLAGIYLRQNEYRKARRHMTSAMIFRPSHPHYYYQYATAVHHDPQADAARAVRYYRQAQR